MTLQTTGAISFGDLIAEFGGEQPHSLGEYYRGGTYVPTEIGDNTVVREPATGYKYSLTKVPRFFWVYWLDDYYAPYTGMNVFWGDVLVYTYNGAAFSELAAITSVTADGYTYYRGTYVSAASFDYGDWSEQYYRLYREGGGGTVVPVNESVPASGAISFSNFYGGTSS